VLLTTQYMEEAEQLASELTVIDRGRVVANGQVAELKAKVGGRTLVISPSDPAQLPAMAAAIGQAGLNGLEAVQTDARTGTVSVPILTDEQLTAVVGLLAARGFGIAHIETHLPSLDEVFLAITGKKATQQDESGTPAHAAEKEKVTV
jgi:oleandomycin transport system ATP-binding protein